MEDSALQIENFYNSSGLLKIKTTCSLEKDLSLELEFSPDKAYLAKGENSTKEEITLEKAYRIAENIINILRTPDIKSGIVSETRYTADVMWDYEGGLKGSWALTTTDMPEFMIHEKLPNIQNPIEEQHLKKALKLNLYNQTYMLYEYVKNF